MPRVPRSRSPREAGTATLSIVKGVVRLSDSKPCVVHTTISCSVAALLRQLPVTSCRWCCVKDTAGSSTLMELTACFNNGLILYFRCHILALRFCRSLFLLALHTEILLWRRKISKTISADFVNAVKRLILMIPSDVACLFINFFLYLFIIAAVGSSRRPSQLWTRLSLTSGTEIETLSAIAA